MLKFWDTLWLIAYQSWQSAVEHFSYQFQLENMLEDLKTTFGDLKELKESVVRRVRSAEKSGNKLINEVVSWIERINCAEADMIELLREGDQEVGRLCLRGFCSTNFYRSHQLGEKFAKWLKELTNLKATGAHFEEVVVPDARDFRAAAEMLPCDPISALEKKLSEVLNYLKREETGTVCVWGRAGVGKTTLLKLINDHFALNPNFRVIWIQGSRHANLEMIQEAIGEKIGLPVELMKDHTSLEERALHICKELKRKQFILLLDDMWEAVDLSKVGVPLSQSLDGSKVVFTTRSERMSGEMRAQKTVVVEPLDPRHALRLFEMSVGEYTINSHPEFRASARTVVNMCEGLPLAIKMLGKNLSGKTEPDVWRRSIWLLARSAGKLKDLPYDRNAKEEELFSILRCIYDNLPNEKVKACLLYCALFPEDFQIHKQALAEFFICENFWNVEDDDEMDSHYDEAYFILGTLVRAGLLNDNGEWITVRDLIRQMALHLGEEDTCVMPGLKLKEAPNVGEWKEMKRVSLMHNDIKELSEVPASPHLLTLLLDNNQVLRKICDGFFESMGKLTVLSLSCTSVEELPRSISRLVSLTYLDISYTKIRKLPVVLKELKELKHFDVSGLALILKRSEKAISNLSSLQVLKMICKYHYDEEGASTNKLSDDDDDDIMLIEEMLCLEHVKVLQLTLGSLPGLKKLTSTRRLWRKIETLCLSHFEAPSIDVSLLAHVKNLDLSITSCDSSELSVDATKSGTGSFGRATFNYKPFSGITRAAVCNCDYLEHLTCFALMTNLTVLKVSDCMALKEVIFGEKLQKFLEEDRSLEPFYKLAVLELCLLPRLRHIYSSNLSFRSLHQLRVCDCPLLEKLPLGSTSVIGPQIELTADKYWFHEIKWEDEATKAALLPRLNLSHSSTTNTRRFPSKPMKMWPGY